MNVALMTERTHQPVATTVEITVAARATIMLFHVASTSSGSRKIARYQSREKCSQIVKRDELKLNTARVSSTRQTTKPHCGIVRLAGSGFALGR